MRQEPGKKSRGKFYTPQEVSRILAEIVSIGHQRLRNVYDPTCGSAHCFFVLHVLEMRLNILRTGKESDDLQPRQNEYVASRYQISAISRLKTAIRLNWDVFGDTQFVAVVANPPFSAEWSAADKFNTDDRFSKAGRLAPKKTADYAFILHMIYHLNEGGTMACVAPHGVLFRGNAEGVIRRFLIEKENYIDAIIGLPANIFYGTSIPTCILCDEEMP